MQYWFSLLLSIRRLIAHHVCLHREFQQERVKEGKAINKEIDTEWEKQLKELTERYEKDMEKKKKKMKDSEKKVNCFQACFVISVNCCAVFYVSLQKKKKKVLCQLSPSCVLPFLSAAGSLFGSFVFFTCVTSSFPANVHNYYLQKWNWMDSIRGSSGSDFRSGLKKCIVKRQNFKIISQSNDNPIFFVETWLQEVEPYTYLGGIVEKMVKHAHILNKNTKGKTSFHNARKCVAFKRNKI